MKCPLSLINMPPHSQNVIYAAQDCLEEDCGWWDEEKNICSVKVIAKELTRIQLHLPNIAKEVTLIRQK